MQMFERVAMHVALQELRSTLLRERRTHQRVARARQMIEVARVIHSSIDWAGFSIGREVGSPRDHFMEYEQLGRLSSVRLRACVCSVLAMTNNR
jgi:hypothetical protein